MMMSRLMKTMAGSKYDGNREIGNWNQEVKRVVENLPAVLPG
jgi:hypothetical protein